jgi:DNA-binding IclR family transcriptional regulator
MDPAVPDSAPDHPGPIASRGRTRRSSTQDDLRSLTCSLAVLNCFVTGEELGTTEIARRVGAANSTVHRILTTLVTQGFVEQNPDNLRYRISERLYLVGRLSLLRGRLREAAAPVMAELHRRTAMSVHLDIAEGLEGVHLERLESAGCRVLLKGHPSRFPLDSTASGLVIAAFDPDIVEARKRTGTEAGTAPQGATAAHVRRARMALTQNKPVEGLASMAVPVFDAQGRFHAALALLGNPATNQGRRPRAPVIAASFKPLLADAARKIVRTTRWPT